MAVSESEALVELEQLWERDQVETLEKKTRRARKIEMRRPGHV